MLKVDLRKAFDSIRWDFVIAALKAINLPDVFVDWISTCITSASFSVTVNGHTGGFFSSTQGLRQGDPLSPYLFVLAMEAFSGLLRSRFSSGYIRYHPHTEELDITHLMFADDVMIFFDGSGSSLHGITETLDDFAGWSGLHMNRDKTELFHAGLSLQEATAVEAYGFSVGSLPIRYLGLPLMHRKLKISEYSPLLDKLNGKFNAWATKSLSFAGRSLLLKTVITGMVNFWISTFSLPQGCINRIESLCSRFLWSGSTDRRAHAKVSWKTVCLPKEEGGLGLRSFKRWNITLLLRLIWLLFSGSDSLWVAWHKAHNYSSPYHFWTQQEAQSQSWNWRGLLRLRDLAVGFLFSEVNNGLTTSFWFDNWTSMGPLIDVFGRDGTRRLRIRIDAPVAAACSPTAWRLPNPRSEEEVSLHAFLSATSLPSLDKGPDIYRWQTNGHTSISYSSSKTWEVLRPRGTIQQSAKQIWYSGAIPKHAFHMWVTNLNRLPTRDRLSTWGMQVPLSCCICSNAPESRDHLMLTCSYAMTVWSEIQLRIRCRVPRFTSWLDLMQWARAPAPSVPTVLKMMVTQSLVYSVWRQRNNMLHNQAITPPLVVFKDINRQVINAINVLRKRKKFINLMSSWLL